jgi:LysM repeat protein
LETGPPKTAPRDPDPRRRHLPWSRPGRRSIVAGALVLIIVVGLVGLRAWTASQSPDIRYVRIDPRPLASATALVSPPAEEAIVEEPREIAEGGSEPGDVALPLMPPPYTVAAGDNLSAIAERLAISVEALRLVNDLVDPNFLRTGQVLVVPPAPSVIHPVDPAQTLREIARLYELDPVVLAAYNGVSPERSNEPLGRAAVLVPIRTNPPSGHGFTEEAAG